jgi:hypothetical protein
VTFQSSAAYEIVVWSRIFSIGLCGAETEGDAGTVARAYDGRR